MNQPMTVVGFAGSLRKRSFNRALLRAAVELAPPGMTIEVLDLAPIPVYNGDLDEVLGGGPYPPSVAGLRLRVEAADAVLMAVPEYNWGPSGVLKNALDWLSRPASASPLANKPVALAGTSPGPAGTGRAQLQLRQNLLSTSSHVLTSPLVQIGGASSHFDDELRLTDPASRELVGALLVALQAWTRRLAAPLEIRID